MTIHIIGARGRLGNAIALEYGKREIHALPRQHYHDWSMPGKSDQVARYFGAAAAPGDVVFVASGLLDPNLPDEMLNGINFHLPANVIHGATKVGLKVVTFGTIMEKLMGASNPYIKSKSALAEYAGCAMDDGKPVVHIRIHTLFGIGLPSPFMFLGQIRNAIVNDNPFKMTAGRQLREYHHLDDESKAIRQLENSMCSGFINLSHGKPLCLREIAESLFAAFDKSALLKVGELPEPAEENFSIVMQPDHQLPSSNFRESLPAIIEYMKICCSAQTVQR